MSDRSALRVLACAVLASPILADLDVGEEPLRAYDEVIRLVGDMDAMVRSAACRALGILVKSPKFVSPFRGPSYPIISPDTISMNRKSL